MCERRENVGMITDANNWHASRRRAALVEKMPKTVNGLINAINDVVADGDAHGQNAAHPTGIYVRGLLELAVAALNGHLPESK